MRYAVITRFKARNGKRYAPGDVFEIDDPARAERLQRRRLIGRALPEPPAQTEAAPVAEVVVTGVVLQPRHVGAGYYLLPDGTKIRGKEAAMKAMSGGDAP